MKYEVKRNKEAKRWTVELPHTFAAKRPALNEPFEVKVTEEGAEPVSMVARYLGDGRSLMIGHEIIRLATSLHAGRNDTYRLGMGGIASSLLQRTASVKTIRPVKPRKKSGGAGGGDIKSPMTGKILSINVNAGDVVEEGSVLLVIEAMKMENRILAESKGSVTSVRVEAGKAVSTGDILLTLTSTEEDTDNQDKE